MFCKFFSDMVININWIYLLLGELSLWFLLFIQFIFFILIEYVKKYNEKSIKFIYVNFIIGLFYTFFIVLNQINFYGYSMNNQIRKDSLINYLILLMLFAFIVSVIYLYNYANIDSILDFEYIILVGFSFLGMLVLLTSNDLLMMYLGIELQSLCLYILAAFKQHSYFSNEASLKYFILGSIASGILLFGITMIYGSLGIINFSELSYLFYIDIDNFLNKISILGILFVIIGLFFKIGVVPFHMWLPDVYEGVPTGILVFFALVPKIAVIGVLIKLTMIIFYIGFNYWAIIFFYGAIFSIIVGTFGALYQVSIKRLLAYSAIGHTGYILLGISTGSIEGIYSVLLYLLLYILTMINIFGIIISLRLESNLRLIKLIENYNIIYNNNKLLGIFLCLSLFSLVGIPPLAGFFSKIFIFLSLLKTGYIFSAGFIIFLSVIGAVYYIKIIKIMLFSSKKEFSFLVVVNDSLAYIIVSTGIIGMLISIFCMPIMLFLHEIILEAYLL